MKTLTLKLYNLDFSYFLASDFGQQQESFQRNLNIQAQNTAKELYKTAGARTPAGWEDD